MGRGRAKAIQAKIARDLKYSAPHTDLTALQRELATGGRPDTNQVDQADPSDEHGDDRHR